MENVSKALIFSAAILITILLTTISIFVLNKSKGAREEAEKKVNSAEVVTFNNKFQIYEGEAVSALSVRSLMQLVKANNAENGFDSTTKVGEEKYIQLKGIVSPNVLNPNNIYSVHIVEYTESGYVSVILIKENS